MASSEKTTPEGTFAEPFPEISGLYFHDLDAPAKWGVVVDHLMSKEKERCEIWKDEVTNILIFAGLFSGVVTAFIIESYQTLQNNPSELFLSRIAASLEFVANKTADAAAVLPAPVSVPSGPSSPNKIVNALWFMSLILSLASALIGLVALQWIREHLRPSTRNVPLRTLPALIQMQAESLDAYYVPQTLTALPVLLILAIVLFFIGMIEFLWNINHTVAYPSMITISLILAFILYTTLRPGLQGLPPIGDSRVFQNKRVSPPSIPCPYRSPQSWAFLQATIFASKTYSSISRHLHIPHRISRAQHAPAMMKDWIDWAVSWPRQRDIDYNHSTGDPHSLYQPFCDAKSVLPPVYDTIRALSQTNRDFSQMGHSNWDTSMVNVDYAFDDFLDFDHGASAYSDQLVDYVHSLLDEPRLPLALPRDRLLSQATREIKRTHATLLFTLSGVANLNELAGAVSSQSVNAALDLVEFNCGHLEQEIDILQPWFGPIALTWHYATLYMFGDAEEADEQEGVEKLIEIVNQIFQYARERQVNTRIDTLGTSPYIRMVLHAIANILVHRSGPDSEIPRITKSRHTKLLITLTDHLHSNSQNPYLFLLASIYAHFVLVPISPRFWGDAVYVRSKAFQNLAVVLRQIYYRLFDNSELLELAGKIFPVSLDPHFVWAYLDPGHDLAADDDDDSSSSDESDDQDDDDDGDGDEDDWEDEDDDGKDGSDDDDDDDIQIDTDDEGEKGKRGKRNGVPDRARGRGKTQRPRPDSRKGRKRALNTVLPKHSLESKSCIDKPTDGAATKSELLSVDTPRNRNQVPQQSLSFGPLFAYTVGPDNKMTKLPFEVVNPMDESRRKGDVIVDMDMDMAKMHGSTLPRHLSHRIH